MASLTDLENQLAAAQASLQGYQDPNLQSTINNQIQAAYSPSLQSATQNVGKMMQDFLPNYFNVPFTGNVAGTSAADLTPQQKMSAMATRLGEMGGQLTAGANYADLLGGRLADAQNRALQALQFGYGAAQGNYGNIFNQLQAAKDEEFRQQQLDLQRAQLRNSQRSISGLGGGGGGTDTGGVDMNSVINSIPGEISNTPDDIKRITELGARNVGLYDKRQGPSGGYIYEFPNGKRVIAIGAIELTPQPFNTNLMRPGNMSGSW